MEAETNSPEDASSLVIDQTQFTSKDTADNEHAGHQLDEPSTENVITKHFNSEQLPTESSIKSKCDEEPPEKILELYSVDNSEIKKDGKVMSEKEIGVPVDGTLKTLSTTACVGAVELENKDEGNFTLEKAKEMEAATDSPPENKDLPAVSTSELVKGHTDEISQQQTHKNDETSVIDTEKNSTEPEDDEKLYKEAKEIEAAMKTQLVNTETESLPKEEVQPRLPTPDIVQQNTDQIIKQQPLNQDQPDVINNAQSCIAEKEPDRLSTVIEEPVELETKDNISILKEQANQQSEETSMQNVTTNDIIEGHVTSESSIKVADDVHKSDSIKNLEKKDENEIREEEATDVKQSTNVEIPKRKAKGRSEDKALQTLPSAELVGTKANDESFQGEIKPEAGLAVTYANEKQALQHEFDTKEEIPEEEACKLIAESEAKSEPQIVAQNNETTCIKHPYLDGETSEINPTNDTIEQEITMSHAKEKLAIEDDKNFNLEEEKGTQKETNMQLEDTTESEPKEEPIQPIARAELVRTKAHDESSPEANVTVKSNKEVQTSNVIEKEEIQDTAKGSQVAEKTIKEPTKSQLKEEEVQTRSPTPPSVQGDTNQIRQQERLYINESEINDNDKQGCIPKIAQDIQLTIAQETEKPETKVNVGIVTEKLDNKHASEIRSEEGTDAKQLTDVEITKSEIEGVPKDEAQQPIANTVLVGTRVFDEGSREDIESEEDAKVLSNDEEQKPEYVTEGTVGINATNYTNEKEEVPTSPVCVKEGIENNPKFSKEEESKRVKEETKMQLQDEQGQTRSLTPAFVQGDTNQIPQQETLCIDESEVFDHSKQWCIPAIEVEKNTTVAQETRNPETKDEVSTVAENLGHKDATEIKLEEGTYAQQSTQEEMPKSERDGMLIDEAQQPMANAVSVRSKALEESSQEIPPKAYVKSDKEVKTPESVTNEEVEISTTNYTEKQEVPKDHVGEGERIGDKFNQEKEEGIEAANTQLLEEEVQIRSSTLVSVQGDTNQIPQQETLHVNESEVIENAIVVQEWELSETKDNSGTIIENLDKDASEIRAKDGTDAKQFSDLEMSKSETEEEIQDNRKFNQREEVKKIDEVTGMQTPQEEVHTTSPTPAFVKSHTDITQQQKAFHLNESNVIATAKQSCIPEFEHNRNPTVFQEIEVFETKHNVNRVMENSDKEETKVRENEKTDTTQLNEESSQQDKQLEADITDKSNKKVQTPEYVTEENVETNITDYDKEKNQNPIDHAKEKEGIEDIFKQEEKEKLIEETTKTHSEEEEVQTHAPAFVIGDTNQIPHQETMHADESKVMENAQQSYIPEIELDGKAIVFQETEVSESLYKKDATEIRVKREIDAKKLTDSEMPKPEIEEDEVLQPIANAELIRTEAVEESGKQEIQAKEDITEETADESNREVLIKKFVITEETAEINTNNCTKEHDTVETSPAKEQEGTGDGAKLHEEVNGIEEKTKTQNPEEEFQTSSPTPAFVQGDSGQTLQQETVNIDESEVLDNDKHRSITEIELDGKSTVVQETNNPEIKENISTGAEDLDNKDAIEVRAEEGAYVKQLTNVEIPNSEIKGVQKDEALQLIANIVLNEAIDEGSQQVIQPQADVTQKSNKDVKTPEYVTAETIEINTTNYTKEQEKVPSIHAEDEGIKNKFNHKEEAKGIEEATKIQPLEEIQTKSPTPIFVQGDKNQVPIQETLAIDGSKVIDSAKQSCIPEIKLDKNTTVAQETEKPETKNIVNIITKNFDDKDASEIRAEEGSYDKQITEVERSNSLTEEYEPIAITVAVGTETVDDSNQEKIQLEEDVAEKKSSTEEQTPHYCDEDTTEINTNNYADEHDKDQTSHAKVKEGIENEENLDQTENAKGIDKTSKMKITEEDIQTRSTAPTIVEDDTDQISQKELLHVVESGVIDNIKQSCTPEMQFDRKFTIVQETENPETEDNIGIITENKGTNNARKIRAEEATDSKKLADFKMHDPEMKDVQDNEAPQPVAIATAAKTETVDDSNKEQIQLEDIIEEKSNKEEQTLQDVAKDTVKINTNNYTNEHDKVQKSHAEVKEGTGDDENFDQDEETKDIEETRKLQLAEQKVQKRSLTPAFVQGDTDQISQKELLHIVESEVIHYEKHICTPETEPDRKSTIVQETEKTDTEENISKETKNLGTNYASKIRAEEEIDDKKLVDLKIPKSEIQEEEVPQPTAIAVVDIIKTVDGSKQEQMNLEEDITEKKSKEEHAPLYDAEDTAEINTNSYTEEHDKVQTSATEVREWIEDDINFGQWEEAKAIAETNKIQLPKKDVQRRSHTPDFVQCNTDHISQQELLHANESEVIDYVKQSIDYIKHSCIQEIELDRKSTIAQETEEPKHQDKEEQPPQYVAEDTAEISTTSYTDQHDKGQTSDAEREQGIEDDENFGPQKDAKAIAETNKMHLLEEEVQTISPTHAFVQSDMEQISQEELLHVDESKVIDYVKQNCIRETNLERKSTVAQETEKPETKDNIRKVTENLGNDNAREIEEEGETNSKNLADFKVHDSETKEGEVRQSIATAVAVLTQTVDDSKLEQIQLDKDITEKKSNKEKQTLQFVAENTAEINTTSYTEEHDKVQKSNVEVKQGIEEDENFGQREEAKATGETNKMQLPKENVQTISPTPAYVQCDTDQTLKQQLLHIDELEVIDYAKQSRIPEIELDRKSTITQETEKLDTKDNISNVTENLGTTNGSEIRAEEETDVKNLADLKIPESEIKVLVRTQSVDDSNQEQIQLEDITEKNSNKGEQTTQNVAGDTAEININSYTDEHDKVQTSDAEVRERSEDDENYGQQEERKGIKETCKMQLPEKEVRTRSPTPAFVQGNIDQISQQEPLHVDESEVIDYMKQSSLTLPEIQLDKKSTVVQGTEKPETKDNVGIATEKLGTSDPSKIRAEKRTDAKISADFMMPKPEIKDTEVPEDEVPQPIEVAVAVETVDDINQKEIQIEEDITEKKSNKDEQSSQYVAKDTTEIKTNSYADEHDKVQTSHAEVNQGTEGDENFGQVEEAKGIEETNKVQLPEEEVQIRSPTPAFVQGDTDQISQQELLLIDESEVTDYVDQSCIPEIELDRKSTTVQETKKPETKNNVSIVTENLGTNDASEITAKEETDAEKLADVKIVKSEIKGVPKDETLKPIANAVLLRTKAVEKSSQQDKQQEEEVSDKSIKEVQSQEYITEGSVEININNEAEEKDKNSTSNAEEKAGIEDIFNQKEKEKEIQEATKIHSVEEEEIQRRSPPPAFVQGDTNQILHQETLHINESEVIHNAKLSYIPEIELHEKAIFVQKSEKVETKDNFDRVRENLNKDESENRAEEGIDVKQLTDLEMPKSEIKGVLEDDSLQPMPDTVSVEKEAVGVSQEKRQPQEEFIEKVNKEVQTPQYFTADREKIETTNDTEEQEEVPTSQPKEKSGNKDDDKFEQEEEKKGIEESTKTQLQDKDISTTLPIQTSVQGDFDQIWQKQILHDDESKGIGNAKRSCMQEIELDGKSTIVEEPETKANVNMVKQEHANNQSKTSSTQGDIMHNITEEGLVTSESNREISEVHTDEQKTVKSCLRENLDNKNASEIIVAKASEAKQSTYMEIQESGTQGEPEDKALKTRLNSSSNGNEGLDESSPEKFTQNLNKDEKTPQCNTKVNAETNITSYPDKLEEAEDIEESIEKQLPLKEIQHTLPTPTSVQEDIDQMSQQQTLHDDEIEVINNAKSCMTEIELDRKSTVVEESKQPETKANADLVKEEQADHQSEESSVQSFITNYIIVERHTTSESNKELSDDVDLDGQKKVESHLEEFLEIKDASEIRAKGIHSKQLTDVEIQKSETEGVAEDKGMQTMSSTTSVKNYAFNECCQEEIQPREEYAETHIKEVKMPHYECNTQKHIPKVYGVEEDTCQIRGVNEQKLESQLASLNKEATFIDNRYSDGEIENANPISDIEKEVNPKSLTKKKLVIQDDSKFNEEEAKGIEEMTKIKVLNSATDCSPEEVQPKLPDPATVQGDTDQILQQQTLPSDALDTIDNNLRSIPENELDRMSTTVEEPETKANINIVEEQSDKRSHEPSMKSLITDYITAEGHLASENNSKLSYDMNEQKTVNLQMVENLGIKYASKTTTEEVTDAKQPTGVELEKTKNEELIENKTLDESNQEEMQPEEDFSETYTKGKKTPQSSMENVNSEGMEITENSTKSSYAEEEPEQVINTYIIENSEIKDTRRIKLEEASDIKEATDESGDKAISFLSTIPSVRIGIVDESIQEKIQKDVQPAVINSKEEQRTENDFVRNMEVLEAFDLKKGPGNTSVENEEKVEVQSEANNQKTIKKHPNLEELETAEISPSSDTKELGKESEVAKLGGVSESISVDITEHIDTGKLETQDAETGISGNTKEDKAGEEFENISPSSSVGVLSRDSQEDTGTKVLHKKSHGILSGVGSKVKHSISKVKKVITGKSSRPKTPPS